MSADSSSDDDDVPLAKKLQANQLTVPRLPPPVASRTATPAAKPKPKPAAAAAKRQREPSSSESSESESSSSESGSESSEEDDDSGSSSSSSSSDTEMGSGGGRKRLVKGKSIGKAKQQEKPKPKPKRKAESGSDSDDRPLSSGAGTTKAPAPKRAKVASGQSASAAAKTKTPRTKKGHGTLFPVSGYEVREKPAPLVPDVRAYKWWAEKAPPEGTRWQALVHNGVLFPPAYKPHGVQMLYDGKPVSLTPEQEEPATWYAAMIDTDFVKDATFNRNFFADWQQLLGPGHTIRDLAKCDFGPIVAWVQADRERVKEQRKDPAWRERQKADKKAEKEVYGFALVDGHLEQVGNYNVEPPGLFRGRGKHPKTGKFKKRLMPEDVTINIGRGVPLPACPMPGHQWKGVIHNPTVTWLAFWRNNINGEFKYVYLAANSKFKGESDVKKYEKARVLKKEIERIRRDYRAKLRAESEMVRQLATAIYLIDVLALRVGNEKDTSEQADTVGCCSLRVEHLQFPGQNRVVFDFLGKDSMRYFNDVAVDPVVCENLRSFCSGKKPSVDVFHKISTSTLNQHLSDIMPGLSAKVFRTFNASHTLEECLLRPRAGQPVALSAPDSEKKLYYDLANKEVAILCNHQRTPPKTFDATMEKLNATIDKLTSERDRLRDHLAGLEGRGGKKSASSAAASKKTKGKSDDDDEEEEESTPPLPNDPSRCRDQLAKKELALTNKLHERKNKEENKQIALGTAKINYMDPRITVAWCKRVQVPIERIFSKALLDKFPWAMEVPPDWIF